MKKAKPIRSSARILVIFFLFASVVSLSVNSFSFHTAIQKHILTKKTSNPSKSSVLISYQEKETEEETDADDDAQGKRIERLLFTHFLIRTVSDPIAYTIAPCGGDYNAPGFYGATADVPLYLAKKTLLI